MPVDTPLHKASHQGDLNKVKEILEAEEPECTVDQAGASERRALQRAAGGNHVAVCEYLISKGATVDMVDKSGRTALHWAAISGHKEAADCLLTAGADMFIQTKTGMSPLHAGVEGGKLEIVTLLLTKVPDERKEELCNLQDVEGNTPCDIAVKAKSKPIVSAMQQLGDPNAKSAACCIM